MTIRSLTVKDFQSVAHAHIDFPERDGGGSITTIVGPSSTGKSALLRAIRMLARNTNSAPVRAGAKKTAVEAQWGDNVISIERGPGHSTYAIGEDAYTKSGVSVPDAVANALGLRADVPDPHFAFQFDRPYLLGETGSVVSDTIGRLTNANVLRAAVREGARRAQHAKSERDMRQADARELAVQIKERFTTLPAREKALVEARSAVEKATALQSDVDVLSGLLEALESARTGLERVESSRHRHDAVFPLVDHAQSAVENLQILESLVSGLDRHHKLLTAQRTMQTNWAVSAQTADEGYAKVLHEAGTCPTCGATT